jgi:hypothetical protein
VLDVAASDIGSTAVINLTKINGNSPKDNVLDEEDLGLLETFIRLPFEELPLSEQADIFAPRDTYEKSTERKSE